MLALQRLDVRPCAVEHLGLADAALLSSVRRPFAEGDLDRGAVGVLNGGVIPIMAETEVEAWTIRAIRRRGQEQRREGEALQIARRVRGVRFVLFEEDGVEHASWMGWAWRAAAGVIAHRLVREDFEEVFELEVEAVAVLLFDEVVAGAGVGVGGLGCGRGRGRRGGVAVG